MTEVITPALEERSIIDLIKENIIEDKKREVQYTDLLKDYVSFLKGEILHKNKLLYSRLHISYKNEDATIML